MAHSVEYLRAIRSDHWTELKREMRDLFDDRCQTCRSSGPLELHHLHYDTLGMESSDDVMILCHQCHEEADLEREEEARDRLYQARLNGWASKVYGEGWDLREDSAEVEERFEEWLEQKESEAY
jgi:5-methylcytosine-specific restriction endonuclease McrA